jgi:hypothetical protein
VTARIVECTFILVGIVAMLGIATLQHESAGATEGTIAYTLAAIKDWTFLLGPGWVIGWGNGLILGYMMYRTRLVPRAWTWLGLVGGPLIIISGTIVLFGGNPASAALKGPASIPEALWELFLGLYCTSRASGRPRRSCKPMLARHRRLPPSHPPSLGRPGRRHAVAFPASVHSPMRLDTSRARVGETRRWQMTTISHEPPTALSRTRWLYNRDIWASLAISAMWLTVMVVSLWGPDMHLYDSSGSRSTIPSGVVIGLFAVIGSWAVAKHGFRRTSDDN